MAWGQVSATCIEEPGRGRSQSAHPLASRAPNPREVLVSRGSLRSASQYSFSEHFNHKAHCGGRPWAWTASRGSLAEPAGAPVGRSVPSGAVHHWWVECPCANRPNDQRRRRKPCVATVALSKQRPVVTARRETSQALRPHRTGHPWRVWPSPNQRRNIRAQTNAPSVGPPHPLRRHTTGTAPGCTALEIPVFRCTCRCASGKPMQQAPGSQPEFHARTTMLEAQNPTRWCEGCPPSSRPVQGRRLTVFNVGDVSGVPHTTV